MNAYRCNENSRLTTLAFNSIKGSQILLNLMFWVIPILNRYSVWTH